MGEDPRGARPRPGGEAGGLTQRRQVMPTRSYLSQVERTVTFGLGTAAEADSLKVVWPDGSEQTVEVAGVDRLQVIVQSPLTTNRDFERIAELRPLELWRP